MTYKLFQYDRVMLHLLMNCPKPSADFHTYEMTQDGIADSVGRTRAHVSTILKDMKLKGYCNVELHRLTDGKNRKTAQLTESGRNEAKKLKEKLESLGIDPKTVIYSPDIGAYGGRTGAKLALRIARLECELADIKRLAEGMK